MVRGRRTRKAAVQPPVQTADVNGSGLGLDVTGSSASGGNGGSSGSKMNANSGSKSSGGGPAAIVSKASALMMEEFCASPKRKEYKVDSNGLVNGGGAGGENGFATACALKKTEVQPKTRMVLRGLANSQSLRNGSTNGHAMVAAAAATNGVSRCNGNEITRFLMNQAKSKSRKNRKKSPNIELVNDDTCDSFTQATTLESPAIEGQQPVLMVNGQSASSSSSSASSASSLSTMATNKMPMLVTNGHSMMMHVDSIEEAGEKVAPNTAGTTTTTTSSTMDYHFHMFARPEGNESVAAAKEVTNIFLQEPVLKLNVDHNCLTLPSAVAVAEASTAMTMPKMRPGTRSHNSSSSSNSALATNGGTSLTPSALLNHDSNSGDSGVVIDKLQEGAGVVLQSPMALALSAAAGRPRQPTTPHRILCPSSPQGGSGKDQEDGECDGGERMLRRKLSMPAGGDVHDDDYEEEEAVEVGLMKNGTRMDTVEVVSGTTMTAATAMELVSDRDAIINDGDKVGVVVAVDASSKQAGDATRMVACQQSAGNNKVAAKGSGHQSTMVDFFKVRRSVRKTKKEVEREEQMALEKAILRSQDDGLAVKMFENKGRGIVATRNFCRGEFVVEYVGEFISIAEANKREKIYAEDQNTGCYMYYFKHKNKPYCIDATEETGKLGRLVNHSRNGNLITKTVDVGGEPHLVLIAKEDIEAGKELTYDYGDRSKESLMHHPWLAF